MEFVKKERIVGLIFMILILFSLSSFVSAQNYQEDKEQICTVYITGVGCPNCAITDPILLTEYTKENLSLIHISEPTRPY